MLLEGVSAGLLDTPSFPVLPERPRERTPRACPVLPARCAALPMWGLGSLTPRVRILHKDPAAQLEAECRQVPRRQSQSRKHTSPTAQSVSGDSQARPSFQGRKYLHSLSKGLVAPCREPAKFKGRETLLAESPSAGHSQTHRVTHTLLSAGIRCRPKEAVHFRPREGASRRAGFCLFVRVFTYIGKEVLP